MTDPLLEQLRAVFLDELKEQLALIERALVSLAQPDSPEDERSDAALEIRRAAHTLKGAARAVSEAEVERLCHALEGAVADARATSGPVDSEHILAVTRPVAEALYDWVAVRETPPVEEPAASPPVKPAATAPDAVRVSLAKVLDISNASEELVVAVRQRERLEEGLASYDQLLATLRRAFKKLGVERLGVEAPEAQAALQALSTWGLEHRRRLHAAFSDVALRADRLSRSTRGLRATRFEDLRPTLELTVRETARDVGREVSFTLEGGDAELDRRVVDRLREPLVHLLRNAVDHGIEPPAERRRLGKPTTGDVTVAVRGTGTDIAVTLTDDGRGIDLEPLRRVARERGLEVRDDDELLTLLFEPGFTTRAEATRTSGRGIGLDVVRQRVAALQGRVTIETTRGQGARFLLRVPADLSVIRGQVVRLRGRPFVLVETAVDRARMVGPDDERVVEGRRYLLEGDSLVPLADLATALGIPGELSAGRRPAVLLSAGERRMAYIVDELGASVDVVIKALGPRVRRAGLVNGAAVLSDGALACVLDAFLLVQQGRPEQSVATEGEGRPAQRVLVVDDSVTTRQLLASLLEAAGYRVDTASDGEAAWRALQSGPLPDLVVSDIEMPRLDGFQLLSRLRASPHVSRIPVVIVTALATDADRRRAVELGADAYVVKSRFDQAALIDTVRELLL